MVSNCTVTILLLGLLVVLVAWLMWQNNSAAASASRYTLLDQESPVELEAIGNRVCRCIPYSRVAMRSVGDWGKEVLCPVGTLLTGERWWCTSDSPECVDVACNSFV